jgi:hypothetical protein
MNKPNSVRRNVVTVTVGGDESRPCTIPGIAAVIARRQARPGTPVTITNIATGQVIYTGVVTDTGYELS